MDPYECISKRRSCRAFLPKAVTKETIERILQAANRSPSYMNSQPWEVFVMAGKQKDAISQEIYTKALNQEAPTPDLSFPAQWPHPASSRIEHHRKRRFKAIGVNPDDKEQVREHFLRNFTFFGAPCVIVFGVDKTLSSWSIFDLGSFVHGLLIAAQAEGLGACPQAVPLSYPSVIREKLAISDDLKLILAVALGYPDADAAVNGYQSQRRDLNEFTHWHGF